MTTQPAHQWRVVTGLLEDFEVGDPHGTWEFTWEDDTFPTYDEARNAMSDALDRFIGDNLGDCETCATDGLEAKDAFAALPTGEEFHAYLDGHDYCLTRVNG